MKKWQKKFLIRFAVERYAMIRCKVISDKKVSLIKIYGGRESMEMRYIVLAGWKMFGEKKFLPFSILPR